MEGAALTAATGACACGSGVAEGACCGRFLDGDAGDRAQPETAEALMRARYTAYTRGDVDFILATHELPKHAPVDRAAIERWARTSEWLGLEVVAVEKGGPGDATGVVEFIARYRGAGSDKEQRLHERSRFRRTGGRWMYLDGDTVRPKPAGPVVAPPKVGRNEPCPCGGGRKWKHCHGAA